MLHGSAKAGESVRFSSPDSLEEYVAGAPHKKMAVSTTAALEETFFLGLRLTKGVDLKKIAAEFGEPALRAFTEAISEFMDWDCWSGRMM